MDTSNSKRFLFISVSIGVIKDTQRIHIPDTSKGHGSIYWEGVQESNTVISQQESKEHSVTSAIAKLVGHPFDQHESNQRLLLDRVACKCTSGELESKFYVLTRCRIVFGTIRTSKDTFCGVDLTFSQQEFCHKTFI